MRQNCSKCGQPEKLLLTSSYCDCTKNTSQKIKSSGIGCLPPGTVYGKIKYNDGFVVTADELEEQYQAIRSQMIIKNKIENNL